MDGEVMVKVEGTEEPAAVVENTVAATIEAATEIAELIVEAKEEGAAEAGEVREINFTLEDIFARVNGISERLQILTDLVMGISDQIAALETLEVAETIVDHTPAEVEEIVETAEEIAPVIETPVVAVEPEIRASKKRRWID